MNHLLRQIHPDAARCILAYETARASEKKSIPRIWWYIRLDSFFLDCNGKLLKHPVIDILTVNATELTIGFFQNFYSQSAGTAQLLLIKHQLSHYFSWLSNMTTQISLWHVIKPPPLNLPPTNAFICWEMEPLRTTDCCGQWKSNANITLVNILK